MSPVTHLLKRLEENFRITPKTQGDTPKQIMRSSGHKWELLVLWQGQERVLTSLTSVRQLQKEKSFFLISSKKVPNILEIVTQETAELRRVSAETKKGREL